jgi:ketosteroid isomerase-like protein
VSTQKNKDVVRRFLDALGRRHSDALRRLVREDVVWWAPPVLESYGLSRPLCG